MSPEVSTEDNDGRAKTIALLEAAHRFPGPYPLSVVTRNDAGVHQRLREGLEAHLAVAFAAEDWEIRESSGGKYASHRIRVLCESGEHVLSVYACVRAIEGVVTVL